MNITKSRLAHTENKQVATRGERGVGKGMTGLWIKRGCLLRIKQMSRRNAMCVTGNIASIL